MQPELSLQASLVSTLRAVLAQEVELATFVTGTQKLLIRST